MELPLELYYEIMIQVPVELIKVLAQTCTSLYKLSTDESLWRERLGRDHSQFVKFKPEGMTWRSACLKIERAEVKLMPVHLNQIVVNQLWLERSMIRTELLRRIFKSINEFVSLDHSLAIYLVLETGDHYLLQPALYCPVIDEDSLWNRQQRITVEVLSPPADT